jgi:double-stranded uracil-DNA glycosylase
VIVVLAISMAAQPLPDLVAPRLSALFVGINPSVRSAELGHHFAGRGNRFWKLLYESGLIAEPITFLEDRRLPSLGLGLTNIVDRATPSCSDLLPEDYRLGRKRLAKKILRLEPKVVAFVGVVVFREYFLARGAVAVGLQVEKIGASSVFVVPNPSGRNAHYSYARMVEVYRELAELIRA